jgi:hypothetical protein
MKKTFEVKLDCSFCGKAQSEVKKLIAGPAVYICNECIGLCNDIIAEEVEQDGLHEGGLRGFILFHLERQERLIGGLLGCAQRHPTALPTALREAVAKLGSSFEDVRVAAKPWLSEVPGPEAQPTNPGGRRY